MSAHHPPRLLRTIALVASVLSATLPAMALSRADATAAPPAPPAIAGGNAGWWAGYADAELDRLLGAVLAHPHAAAPESAPTAPRTTQAVLLLVGLRAYAQRASVAGDALQALRAQRDAVAATSPTAVRARELAAIDEKAARTQAVLRDETQRRDACAAALRGWLPGNATVDDVVRRSMEADAEPLAFRFEAPSALPDMPQADAAALQRARRALQALQDAERDCRAAVEQARLETGRFDQAQKLYAVGRVSRSDVGEQYEALLVATDDVLATRATLAAAWALFHAALASD